MSPNERGVVTEESGIPHYSPAPPLSRSPAATVRGIRLTKSKAGAAIRFLWSMQRRSPAGEISIGNRRPRQGPAGPLAERAELAATVPAFDMLLYTAAPPPRARLCDGRLLWPDLCRAAHRRVHRPADAVDAFPRGDPQSRVTLRAVGRPAGGPRSEHCALASLDHRRKVSAVPAPENAADRRQQPRAFGERAAVAPRRIARRRAALRRAAADACAVSAEPQLGRRDLPGDRAGPPPRLRVRH